jgi:hypothetical protein
MTQEAVEGWNEGIKGRLTERQLANICGWIREHSGIVLDSNDLTSLLETKTPSVSERADKALLEIERQANGVAGAWVQVFADQRAAEQFIGATWSVNIEELRYLVGSYLSGVNFLNQIGPVGSHVITPSGYQYLERLKEGNTESKIGFCAMWFSNEVLSLWTDGIELAIQGAGYEAKRIDRHEHNNKIDDEIIAMIRKSRFVIADFTGQRGGVYFESGFALGLGSPVIWTCRVDDLNNVHFDNRQYNFVTWDAADLPDFRARLQNRIEATLGPGPVVGGGA